MQSWINAIRAQADAMADRTGSLRCGIVQSVDPSTYCARVTIQPEGVLTGWLPIASQWSGSGWGLIAPPSPGQQVIILAQEGQAEHGIILGGLFSLQAAPPPAPVGELWITHSSGSMLKLHNDGSIEGRATVWNLSGVINLSGNLIVSGDISDQGGGHGTIATLRQIYDAHVHPNVQSGPDRTGLPDPQA